MQTIHDAEFKRLFDELRQARDEATALHAKINKLISDVRKLRKEVKNA